MSVDRSSISPSVSPPALPRDYADILQILPNLPQPDTAAAAVALAGLADLSPAVRQQRAWLARWQGGGQGSTGQGRQLPRVAHPRLSIFAANHGVARLAPPPVPAIALLAGMADPAGPLARLVEEVDADLRLYEMNLAAPSADLTHGPAMTASRCVQAMTYGMMAVDMGLDLLALASCGDGADLSAVLLLSAALEQPLTEMLRLTGQPVALAEKLQPALDRLQRLPPCEVLEQAGGYDIAALMGAMLAARMAHTPVVIADWPCLAALTLIQKLEPRAMGHVALAGRLTELSQLPDLLRIGTEMETVAGRDAARAIRQLQAAA